MTRKLLIQDGQRTALEHGDIVYLLKGTNEVGVIRDGSPEGEVLQWHFQDGRPPANLTLFDAAGHFQQFSQVLDIVSALCGLDFVLEEDPPPNTYHWRVIRREWITAKIYESHDQAVRAITEGEVCVALLNDKPGKLCIAYVKKGDKARLKNLEQISGFQRAGSLDEAFHGYTMYIMNDSAEDALAKLNEYP